MMIENDERLLNFKNDLNSRRGTGIQTYKTKIYIKGLNSEGDCHAEIFKDKGVIKGFIKRCLERDVYGYSSRSGRRKEALSRGVNDDVQIRTSQELFYSPLKFVETVTHVSNTDFTSKAFIVTPQTNVFEVYKGKICMAKSFKKISVIKLNAFTKKHQDKNKKILSNKRLNAVRSFKVTQKELQGRISRNTSKRTLPSEINKSMMIHEDLQGKVSSNRSKRTLPSEVNKSAVIYDQLQRVISKDMSKRTLPFEINKFAIIHEDLQGKVSNNRSKNIIPSEVNKSEVIYEELPRAISRDRSKGTLSLEINKSTVIQEELQRTISSTRSKGTLPSEMNKSIGWDDKDLLEKNFVRLPSDEIDEKRYPEIKKIFRDNIRESIGRNSATDKNFLMNENQKFYFDALSIVSENPRQATPRFSLNKGRRRDSVFDATCINELKNCPHFTHFQKAAVFDESLNTTFYNNEETEFKLALQYTELFIKETRGVRERSTSGYARDDLKDPNYNTVEYYGNFGFVDGINLEVEPQPAHSISTITTEAITSESKECFQALSHMCHLKDLLSRRSVFQKSDNGMPTSTSNTLKYMKYPRSSGSSKGSVDGTFSNSSTSVDNDLIEAFTELISLNSYPNSKSTSIDTRFSFS